MIKNHAEPIVFESKMHEPIVVFLQWSFGKLPPPFKRSLRPPHRNPFSGMGTRPTRLNLGTPKLQVESLVTVAKSKVPGRILQFQWKHPCISMYLSQRNCGPRSICLCQLVRIFRVKQHLTRTVELPGVHSPPKNIIFRYHQPVAFEQVSTEFLGVHFDFFFGANWTQESAQTQTLFVIAFIGSLDDLTLFVPMLVGKGCLGPIDRSRRPWVANQCMAGTAITM